MLESSATADAEITLAPHLLPPVHHLRAPVDERASRVGAHHAPTLAVAPRSAGGVAGHDGHDGDTDIMVDKAEIEEIRTIGSGSCGEVVLARWRGGLVACKKIYRALIHGDALQEFMAEVRIMRRLRHPNIVLYMGMFNSAAGETGIVTEYLRRGSLADVLAAEGKSMSVARLMHMAGDTARGMNYLHACRPPIIHRDLKSHNLLVGDGYTIKVTDFGLARQFGGDRATTFCGTLPWTAPEVFSGGGYTERADVYSFGVVMWELCARGTVEPYAGLAPPTIIVGVTRGTLRPHEIDGAPPPLARLATRCWALDANSRPSIGECLRELVDAEDVADREEQVAAEAAAAAAAAATAAATAAAVAAATAAAATTTNSRKRPTRNETSPRAIKDDDGADDDDNNDDNDGSESDDDEEEEESGSKHQSRQWTPAEVTRRFHEASQQADGDDAADQEVSTRGRPKRRKQKRSLSSAWELDATEIEFENELGSGTSAVVYRGRYRGQPVAIKVLKDAAPDDEFSKELEIMASIRSPNVVFFYGAMFRPKTALVVEFFKHGSLYDVMRGESSDVLFDWDLVLRLALGGSRAVAALHAWKPVVVHRDLKSPNLLVDDSFNVKVGDFGLARFKTDVNRQTLRQLRGTYAYLAPESYQGQEFTTKSDVYSLAIILWELVNRLITGEYKRPYEDLKHLRFDYQIIIQTAKNGLRPVVHASCPPPLTQLMQRGWHVEPQQRPSAEEMRDALLDIQRLYEAQKRAN